MSTTIVKISVQDYNKLKTSVPNFSVKESGASEVIVEIKEEFKSTLSLNNIEYIELSRMNS